MTHKQKGNRTELLCMAAFVENGCSVSIPYGDNPKYDFIFDNGTGLYRVQVKTARDNGRNGFEIDCRRTLVNTKRVINERYKKNEVDYFATFWEGKCYLVPTEEVSLITFRIGEPLKKQGRTLRYAEECELSKQLEKLATSSK